MANPQTIVQLVPQLQSGGVERGTLEISRAVVDAGHRSIVISGGGSLESQLQNEGGEHVSMQIWKKSPTTLASIRRLRRWIVETRANVLHARSRIPAWVTWLALKGLPETSRPRLVTTVHGLNRPSRYSRIMTCGERVIAVSDTCRNYLLKCYPDLDASKISVIHRGVDPAEFPHNYQPSDAWTRNWYRQYPQLQGQFVACMAGRVTRLKGHVDLLQAISRLRASGIIVHVLIAGGEDPRRVNYSAELRERIRSLGLQQQVVFTGRRSDIREIMAISDVSVSATADPPESFGRSVLESVRLGRVTLGYAHGGVGEVLSAVYPQGCVPLSDIDALTARLRDAVEGSIQPPQPSSHFLLSTMQQQTLNLYEEIGDCRSRSMPLSDAA